MLFQSLFLFFPMQCMYSEAMRCTIQPSLQHLIMPGTNILNFGLFTQIYCMASVKFVIEHKEHLDCLYDVFIVLYSV